MSRSEIPLSRAAATTERYRAAVERGDVEGFLATLAPGAVLHSPITLRTHFRGLEDLRELMVAVFATIDGIEFYEEIGDATTRALFYRARVGTQEVEEATLMRLDREARVTELTLWFRPLPGLTAVMAGLGPKLAARHGRPRAAAAAAMTAPLAALTRVGDRVAVRLLKRS